METLSKFLKAAFFDGDEPDKKAILKFKDYLLMGYIILTLLCIGASMLDDDSSNEIEEDSIELVESED